MVAPLNLLTDAWLPVIRRSGEREVVRPAQITERYEDPIVAVDWPRPDFRIATVELLTGLLTTAYPPEIGEWIERWEQPPTPST